MFSCPNSNLICGVDCIETDPPDKVAPGKLCPPLPQMSISAHLQYAYASAVLYTFMREIQKCGNVILGTRWN